VAATDSRDDVTQQQQRNKLFPTANSVRSVGALIAVVVGIVAVTILAVFTMAYIDSGKDANAMIPLATAAFGVISAVVGAYLGIKIGTDQSAGFAEEANRAHAKLGALQGFVPEGDKEAASKAADDAAAGAERVRRR
jgi:uncharacterized integral membrane protein